jgi:glutaminyl-tRNA synthetase
LKATTREPVEGLDFIRRIVKEDCEAGTYGGRVVTRFPPEPNGFLHIGHAKSICLNFGVAADFGGVCHLRFDDTNPETEDMMYVESIVRDVRWLGFDWKEKLFFASDYYGKLHDFALRLIRDGKAYVDSLTEEEIREYRGTVTVPGRESPYRNRSVEENLGLFARMREGEFPDGAHVLRAKIDMAAANMKMRDPLLYRIRHAAHYRTAGDWCIYPMYDFAHPLSDAIEGITHSICTLEFENNRAVYDWLMENLVEEGKRPRQYEFARLNLDYTLMSKRKLLRLVEERCVAGWDDPRMPTIAGLRRRGYTPEGIRLFASRIGVDKTNSRVSVELLEDAVRDDLNARCPRVMAILDPLKVTITNWPEGREELLPVPWWPRDIGKEGGRELPLSREIVIERGDFSEDPPADWMRLAPGAEVRLQGGYFLRCDEVVRDPATGKAAELLCSYDPDSLGKPAGSRKKRSTAIQWLSLRHAAKAEVRLYDRLFTAADPEDESDGKSLLDHLNRSSVTVLPGALVEPGLAAAAPGERFQFVRQGYFVADEVDSRPGSPVFNRIIGLKDSYRAGGAAEREKGGTTAKGGSQSKGSADRKAPAVPVQARREERVRAPEAMLLPDRYRYYVNALGIAPPQAELLADNGRLSAFFDEAVACGGDPKELANRAVNDVLREMKAKGTEPLPFRPADLSALTSLVAKGEITATAARSVFEEMAARGGEPAKIAARLGLLGSLPAAELDAAVERVLSAQAAKVAEYRAGKTALLGLFTGLAMKETGGKTDPKALQEALRRKLGRP